jgi:hypothetical protein
MVRYISLLLPLAALAACGGPQPADPLDPEDRAQANEIVAEVSNADMLMAGQWETKSLIRSIAASGLPAESKEEIKGTEAAIVQCLPEEDRARPTPRFFTGSDEGECSYGSFSMKDGKIDAAMACTGTPGSLNFALSGTYTQTSYDIDARATRSGGAGAAVNGSAKLSGTWLGACEGRPTAEPAKAP